MFKKSFKAFLFTLFVIPLIFIFTACGDKDKNDGDGSNLITKISFNITLKNAVGKISEEYLNYNAFNINSEANVAINKVNSNYVISVSNCVNQVDYNLSFLLLKGFDYSGLSATKNGTPLTVSINDVNSLTGNPATEFNSESRYVYFNIPVNSSNFDAEFDFSDCSIVNVNINIAALKGQNISYSKINDTANYVEYSDFRDGIRDEFVSVDEVVGDNISVKYNSVLMFVGNDYISYLDNNNNTTRINNVKSTTVNNIGKNLIKYNNKKIYYIIANDNEELFIDENYNSYTFLSLCVIDNTNVSISRIESGPPMGLSSHTNNTTTVNGIIYYYSYYDVLDGEEYYINSDFGNSIYDYYISKTINDESDDIKITETYEEPYTHQIYPKISINFDDQVFYYIIPKLKDSVDTSGYTKFKISNPNDHFKIKYSAQTVADENTPIVFYNVLNDAWYFSSNITSIQAEISDKFETETDYLRTLVLNFGFPNSTKYIQFNKEDIKSNTFVLSDYTTGGTYNVNLNYLFENIDYSEHVLKYVATHVYDDKNEKFFYCVGDPMVKTNWRELTETSQLRIDSRNPIYYYGKNTTAGLILKYDDETSYPLVYTTEQAKDIFERELLNTVEINGETVYPYEIKMIVLPMYYYKDGVKFKIEREYEKAPHKLNILGLEGDDKVYIKNNMLMFEEYSNQEINISSSYTNELEYYTNKPGYMLVIRDSNNQVISYNSYYYYDLIDPMKYGNYYITYLYLKEGYYTEGEEFNCYFEKVDDISTHYINGDIKLYEDNDKLVYQNQLLNVIVGDKFYFEISQTYSTGQYSSQSEAEEHFNSNFNKDYKLVGATDSNTVLTFTKGDIKVEVLSQGEPGDEYYVVTGYKITRKYSATLNQSDIDASQLSLFESLDIIEKVDD